MTFLRTITLKNNNGIEVRILNYGAIIMSIMAPDRNGHPGDISLGFDTPEEYIENNIPYFGCIVGRFAGRIENACFSIGSVLYNLRKNSPPHQLHGGINGFNSVFWNIIELSDRHVTLHYLSLDGEEGYPGNLDVTVKYSLTDANELVMNYLAASDKPTFINLTNHSYFNLACAGPILSHELTIPSKTFLPMNSELITTGKILPVSGTPMDFTTRHQIGERINENHAQLNLADGYDHDWLIDNPDGTLKTTAILYEPESGRTLTVQTTKPALHLYTGNFLDGSITGKNGVRYQKQSGLCLETQYFPNSPNRREFPDVLLMPGSLYNHSTVFSFTSG